MIIYMNEQWDPHSLQSLSYRRPVQAASGECHSLPGLHLTGVCAASAGSPTASNSPQFLLSKVAEVSGPSFLRKLVGICFRTKSKRSF